MRKPLDVTSSLNRTILLLCLILGGAALASASLEGQGIKVTPMLIEISLAPGESYKQIIRLTNSAEETVTVLIGKTDFAIMQDGVLDLLEAGSLPTSLTSWFSLPTNEITVEGGETETLALSITRPPDSSPLARWSAIDIQSAGPIALLDNEGGISIATYVKFVVAILQSDPEIITRSGYVTAMDVEIVESDECPGCPDWYRTVTLSATFSSRCDNILMTDVRFEIKDETGETMVAQVMTHKPILPRHNRIFRAAFSANDWPPGQYIALTIVDYGGDNPVGGQRPFEIPEE